MLPSMRYKSTKLSQLYHQKRLYNQHQNALNKIKNRSVYSKSLQKPRLNISVGRIQHLKQLKNRFTEHFNYTQMVRGKQICKGNLSLFEKVFTTQSNRRGQILQLKNSSKKSLTSDNQKIWNNQEYKKSTSFKPDSIKNPQERKKMILRNHRQSPINKSTALDRDQQNLRLAQQISKLSPTINTRKLEKMHAQTKELKQRIMKFDSGTPKSSNYLDRKFSSQPSFRANKDNKSLDFEGCKTSHFNFQIIQNDPK